MWIKHQNAAALEHSFLTKVISYESNDVAVLGKIVLGFKKQNNSESKKEICNLIKVAIARMHNTMSEYEPLAEKLAEMEGVDKSQEPNWILLKSRIFASEREAESAQCALK